MVNRVVLLGMIASMPWTTRPMRHRECEVAHTLRQTFFVLAFPLNTLAKTEAFEQIPRRGSPSFALKAVGGGSHDNLSPGGLHVSMQWRWRRTARYLRASVSPYGQHRVTLPKGDVEAVV